MQLGDLVYPFQSEGDNKTIGMIVDLFHNRCSVYGVLVGGNIYTVPRHKLVLAW